MESSRREEKPVPMRSMNVGGQETSGKNSPRNGDEIYMKRSMRMIGMTAALGIMIAASAASYGEEAAENKPEEAGLAEIQGILEVQPVGDIDGMDLEALTSALSDSVMGEYYDPVSGFRMQYPSVLQFTEKDNEAAALSDDGRIRMTIESTPDGKQLTVQALTEAVRLGDPAGTIREYAEQSSFVMESTSGDEFRIDLYTLLGDWLHHVTITCPRNEKETVMPFVEYMINSITTDGGDVG